MELVQHHDCYCGWPRIQSFQIIPNIERMDMASHMGVQSFATSRNAQVETFVGYVLEQYCEKLVADGVINKYSVESQKHYVSDIASDVWDHFVSFRDNQASKDVELWCQTTCYKGNKTGKPEPNKTYEVRETLVEAISFRDYVMSSSDIVRTIHFTVGSKKYTYDWFVPVKEKTFDLSLYLEIDNEDIFESVSKVFEGVATEFQVKNNLADEIIKKTSLGCLISNTTEILSIWHVNNKMPIQPLANKQFLLVENSISQREDEIRSSLRKSINAGQDIKKRCNDLVHGGRESDPYIIQTVDLLLEKNPFIYNAKKALADWHKFSERVKEFMVASDNLPEFIRALWVSDKKLRLLVRRLLMRIGADEAINYVQDVNIEGVTEHNLYKGVHKGEQLVNIVNYVLGAIPYSSVDELYEALISKKAKKILQSSMWFEARNGTDLKPSFDYIGLVLRSKGYTIKPASSLKDKPIGYHSQLVDNGENVNSYTNLKVVINPDGILVAYIKGKYFRPPEFPRRCKEEAYVALTLKNKFSNDEFEERIHVPILMFIDMPCDFSPPEYALKRLIAFGWSAVFSLDDIIEILDRK